jgi:hypothetical protein
MAVHTYIVQPLVNITPPQATDVLWQASGTADGISFTIQFWQSAVAGKTLAQIQAQAKAIIDPAVFTPTPVPSGTLAAFSGGTFTL